MSETSLQHDVKVAKRAIEAIQERLISAQVKIAPNTNLAWAVGDALDLIKETIDALDTVDFEAGCIPFDL